MLQNHAWVKDPFKIRGRPVTNIRNVDQYGFRFCIAIDLYETATCQVWTSIKEYLQFLFQPHIFVRLDTVHMLQPKPHIATD